MSRKHAKIEQLDGNTSLPVCGYGYSDEVDDEIEHFLEKGYVRDPSVTAPPYGRQLWICIKNEIRKTGLSLEEREAEFKLINS